MASAAGSGSGAIPVKAKPTITKSKYVLVDNSDDETTSDGKDVKATVVPKPILDGTAMVGASGSNLKHFGDMLKAGSGFGKKGVFTMRIVLANQTISAANTTSAPVYAIEPTISSEMSSYLVNLYSEFRVRPEIQFLWNLGWSAAPTQQFAVVAYNPTDDAALGSVSFGLQSSQHQAMGYGPAFTSPQSVNADGFRRFTVKMLSGVVTNGSVTGLAGANQWLPISSTSGKFGYIKAYVPNGGGSVTSFLQSYMIIDVEFRNRV